MKEPIMITPIQYNQITDNQITDNFDIQLLHTQVRSLAYKHKERLVVRNKMAEKLCEAVVTHMLVNGIIPSENNLKRMRQMIQNILVELYGDQIDLQVILSPADFD